MNRALGGREEAFLEEMAIPAGGILLEDGLEDYG